MCAWNVSYIIRQFGWSTSRTRDAASSAQFTRYISKRFRYSMTIVTSRVAAYSAAARRLSTDRSRSSRVGPAPLKKPSGASSGPQSVWAPSAAQASTADLVAARPRARTSGSALIGLSSSERAPTPSAASPSSSSRRPSRPYFSTSLSKIGISTPS